MHLLVLFLTINHQCMVRYHLKKFILLVITFIEAFKLCNWSELCV